MWQDAEKISFGYVCNTAIYLEIIANIIEFIELILYISGFDK
ncbi:hypothetical protein PL321_05800 [Caloramator sp. mosi_1]|nr:hypothetical protein [Caloramator sp. mosi_1]WDC85038.1 hypothetical protein PL321_05800 [Caloramator sp. mosi_1]